MHREFTISVETTIEDGRELVESLADLNGDNFILSPEQVEQLERLINED